MDSFSLIKEIKQDVSLSEISILMASAKPGIKNVMRDMDIAEFIEKPFDVDKLKDIVTRILKRTKRSTIDKN